MNNLASSFDRFPSRRSVLQAAASSALIAPVLSQLAAAATPSTSEPDAPARLSNGGSDPFPIPWLDKNGNHNQPAGPNAEASHVYHFKGRVGRCAGFTGMGTDNAGNRLAFGTKTTDFGFMDGEYFAGRMPHQVPLTHI